MINGSFVWMFFWVWYVKVIGENMEFGFVVLDIEIENSLNSKVEGCDE